jgi:hypothetical protein
MDWELITCGDRILQKRKPVAFHAWKDLRTDLDNVNFLRYLVEHVDDVWIPIVYKEDPRTERHGGWVPPTGVFTTTLLRHFGFRGTFGGSDPTFETGFANCRYNLLHIDVDDKEVRS